MARASLGSALALYLGAIVLMSGIGCRRLWAPPAKLHDLSAGIAKARTEEKLVVLVVGADWDKSSTELEQVTLIHRDVRAMLDEDFVAVKIDVTEESDETYRQLSRFKVVGEPEILVLARDYSTVVARENRFLDPPAMLAFLREARDKAR
jgi:thiol:disulfide interchange protein